MTVFRFDRDLLASLMLLLAVQSLLAIGTALTAPGPAHSIAIVLLVATSLVGAAGLGCLLQRRLLGAGTREASGELPRVLRWTGQYVAGTAGPLLSALLLVGAIVLGSGLMPVSGAGAVAGLGAVGLVLPACLLVAGAAALKLPARALDRTLETADVIRLLKDRELKVLPVACVLLASFGLLAAGVVMAAAGVVFAALVLLPAVPLALLGAGMAARRYAELTAVAA